MSGVDKVLFIRLEGSRPAAGTVPNSKLHNYVWYNVSLPISDFETPWLTKCMTRHYNDVIMSMIASQITSLTIVYSTFYSGADQRKHQSSASLAVVRGIHRNSPHKWPVTREMFPFDDVIMDLGTPSVNSPQTSLHRIPRRLSNDDRNNPSCMTTFHLGQPAMWTRKGKVRARLIKSTHLLRFPLSLPCIILRIRCWI